MEKAAPENYITTLSQVINCVQTGLCDASSALRTLPKNPHDGKLMTFILCYVALFSVMNIWLVHLLRITSPN